MQDWAPRASPLQERVLHPESYIPWYMMTAEMLHGEKADGHEDGQDNDRSRSSSGSGCWCVLVNDSEIYHRVAWGFNKFSL